MSVDEQTHLAAVPPYGRDEGWVGEDARADQSESGGGSWPSKHKCADGAEGVEPGEFGRSCELYARQFRKTGIDGRGGRPLTVRSTEIREDCTYISEIFDAVRSKPLDAVVGEWRRMIKKYRRRAIVAEGTNPETGEREEVTMPAQTRWSEGREAEVYNRLMSLERGVEERYGDNYSTVMLTFTASNKSASEMAEYRCMADHLEDVLSSWGVVRRELARQLEGREWHYARVLEPQKSGYAHAHVAVFVKGRVSEERFRPVVEKHTEYVDCAGGAAHTLEKAVSRTDGDEMQHPGQYLAEYIMQNYGEDVLEADPHIQRFNAVMWATGKRRFSVSQGVKELVELGRREGDEPEGWLLDCELVGLEIEDAETGEKTRYTDWDGGSVQMQGVDPSPGKDPPVQRPAEIPD